MKKNNNSFNRKTLLKFLGIILISALIGGVFGSVIGIAGASSLADQILSYGHAFLQVFTPWLILIVSIPLLGVSCMHYLCAKKN